MPFSTSTTDQHNQLLISGGPSERARADWWRFSWPNTEATRAFGNADEFADALLFAVRKKADRTPLFRVDQNWFFAIDANRSAGLSLDSVITRVSEKHAVAMVRDRFPGYLALSAHLELISWLRFAFKIA